MTRLKRCGETLFCIPPKASLLSLAVSAAGSPVSRNIIFIVILCQLAGAQSPRRSEAEPQVTVTVTDENGAAVVGARILRNDMEANGGSQAETAFRGRGQFRAARGT